MASKNPVNIDTIRNEKIDTLNDLIEITRDNAKFYSDAATKVGDSKLKTLFTEMAASKNKLLTGMAKEVKHEGAKPAETGTIRGTWDRFFSDVRGKLGDSDFSYVKGLEAAEDRLLTAFDNVVRDDKVPAPVKASVNEFLPTIRKQHDVMRDTKWAAQPRA